MAVVLGIDAGATSTRCVALERAGREVLARVAGGPVNW